MSEIDFKILEKIEDVKSDITDMKITLIRNTESLEHHVRRTDELQDIVLPVYKDFMARQAVNEYKEAKQKAFLYKLKLPAAIIAAISAIGTIVAWIGRK